MAKSVLDASDPTGIEILRSAVDSAIATITALRAENETLAEALAVGIATIEILRDRPDLDHEPAIERALEALRQALAAMAPLAQPALTLDGLSIFLGTARPQ